MSASTIDTAVSTTAPTRTAGTGAHPIRGFRPDIEALRAIAVLLVVLYHAQTPLLTGGYVGVSVFFVISGFLISLHLITEIERTGKLRIGRFYARRARRLIPAASAVIIATVVVAWVLVSGLYAADVGGDAVWASLFGANVNYAISGVDYQANQDPSAFQHFWSLSAEEQFYFVWPILLLVAAVVARRVARPSSARVGMLVAIAIFGAASFALETYLMAVSPTIAYFLMPSRAWELALGALVAVAAPWLVRWRLVQNGYLVLAGLGAIILAGFVLTDETPYPGTAALLPTLGTAVVIAAGLRSATFVESGVLQARPLQLIGRLSYGLYLWHWPVLILAPLILGHDLSLVEALVLCGLAFILAIFTNISIEVPFQKAPGLQSTSRGLLLGGIAIGLTLAVAASAILIAPLRYRTGEDAAPADRDAIVAEVEAALSVTTVPGNLTPSLADASKDKPDLQAADGISCMVSLLESDVSAEPGGSCVAGGTENGDTTVVLVGDSHAYHWMPALREIALDRGWRLLSFTKGGCPFWDVELVNTNLKRDYTECYEWRDNVTERIREEKPDLIISSAAIFNPRPGDFADRWVAGVTTGVSTLVDMGAPVYVIEDTPYPKSDVPKCIAKNMTDTSACVLTPAEAYSDNDRRERSAAAAEAAGAHLIDPYRWFCSSQGCPVIVGNTVVYTDNSHMSSTYSATLAEVLGKELPQ
jgi:peptidoglycan/LPS O-acetylase OafA/YrhL